MLLISKKDAGTYNELVEFLYKHHYNEMVGINANNDISYYIDRTNKDIVIHSNVFLLPWSAKVKPPIGWLTFGI